MFEQFGAMAVSKALIVEAKYHSVAYSQLAPKNDHMRQVTVRKFFPVLQPQSLNSEADSSLLLGGSEFPAEVPQ